jgi:putative transposase
MVSVPAGSGVSASLQPTATWAADRTQPAELQLRGGRAHRAWTGDITYIPTNEGWLYLAVVIDLFSRRVVGWSMQSEMHSNQVIDALEMARLGRSHVRSAGHIFHSDRGSQYASREFGGLLQEFDITASMSRKGNCWDNAPSETLFASVKVERLHGQHFETIRQAEDEILAWLLWYNQTRMYSTLDYVSPIQFEQQWHRTHLAIAS